MSDNTYCPNCNELIYEGDVFCSNCGSKITVVEQPKKLEEFTNKEEEISAGLNQLEKIIVPTSVSLAEEMLVKGDTSSLENKVEIQSEKEDESIPIVKYVEPHNVFASGLPDWTIEPPQVLVRKKARK